MPRTPFTTVDPQITFIDPTIPPFFQALKASVTGCVQVDLFFQAGYR
jgi:hypothetical protein